MLLAFPTGSAMPVPVSCCTHYSQQSQHPKAEEGHQDSFHPMAGGKRWSTFRFGSLGRMAGQLLLKHSVKHLGSGKRQHQQISLANSLPPANRGIKIQQQTSALPFVVQCMNSLSAGDRGWESLVVVQGATLGNRRKSEEAKKRTKKPQKNHQPASNDQGELERNCSCSWASSCMVISRLCFVKHRAMKLDEKIQSTAGLLMKHTDRTEQESPPVQREHCWALERTGIISAPQSRKSFWKPKKSTIKSVSKSTPRRTMFFFTWPAPLI